MSSSSPSSSSSSSPPSSSSNPVLHSVSPSPAHAIVITPDEQVYIINPEGTAYRWFGEGEANMLRHVAVPVPHLPLLTPTIRAPILPPSSLDTVPLRAMDLASSLPFGATTQRSTHPVTSSTTSSLSQPRIASSLYPLISIPMIPTGKPFSHNSALEFTGTGGLGELRKWVPAMQLAVIQYPINTQMLYALQHLTRDALQQLVLSEDISTIVSWEALIGAFENTFGNTDDDALARIELANISMGKSASQFAQKFRSTLARIISMDARTALNLFYVGLTADACKHVANSKPLNMKEAYQACGVYDATQQAIATAHALRGSRPSSVRHHNMETPPQDSTPFYGMRSPVDHKERIMKKYHKSDADLIRLRGLCFKCEKPGHIARECKGDAAKEEGN
eukprot:TRINITY_DN4817_c0_g3_i4.p2 TRINITY_DN4817_c0_g3~~TRINITY_DN4817_c0_g3_i4.p2  ORF type:complete len:393 (+),score=66.71 TRINITY_DN4817_c0_g3_i4:452-1630(+)